MSMFFVLITGKPGIGKTTIIKRLIDELGSRNKQITGFFTEELRDDKGNRIGFDVVSLNGSDRGILARNNQSFGKHFVGNYSVDTTSLDLCLQPIYECQTKTDIIVLDEIGKMELKSVFFTNFVEKLISNNFKCQVIVATVPIARTVTIVEQIKCLPNSNLFCITKVNRIKIYNDIKKKIIEILNKNEEKH